MLEHQIDLQKVFSPGDTVLFRFRLFSDTEEAGWGWVIDDLSIQEEAPVGLRIPLAENSLSLHVFPVPAETTIILQLSHASRDQIYLEIRDLTGRLVHQVVNPGPIDGKWEYIYPTFHLQEGLYFIRIEHDGRELTHKFMKK